MIEYRFEIEARLESGVTEHLVDGSALQLVTVCLLDGPGVVDLEGEPAVSLPVLTHLRPSRARELAFCLLELAERRTEADDERG
jgi:hypothetical protein